MRKLAFLWMVAFAAACARASVEGAAPAPPLSHVEQPGAIRMTTPRSNHAAILLNDGRVLICGGSSDNRIGGVLASAELYDRIAGFTPTSSMNEPRMGHTLTMLENGKVLVIGGLRNVGYRTALASAELYDPATGAFTPTGRMSTPRENHTATLLRSGKVLIAGGSDNGISTLSSAEVYDPVSGAFHSVGRMNAPRESHAATLLIGGKVLVTGGARANMPGAYIAYNSTEIYDPATSQFSWGPPMTTERLGHTATLLETAEVLAVGGRVRIAAAPRSMSALKSAEIFDPEFGNFQRVGSMPAPRFLQTATLLHNGWVLIVGGWNLFGPFGAGTAQAELYDPLTRAFTTAGSTHTARVTHTATLLPDGEVLVAGGVDALGKVTASVEFYDPIRRGFADLPASSASHLGPAHPDR